MDAVTPMAGQPARREHEAHLIRLLREPVSRDARLARAGSFDALLAIAGDLVRNHRGGPR